MLTELRIRNFALIDQLSVRLGPGLNVLTGETGAGKSIIVGALSLLLGERASAEVVRTGADRASVEGAFQIRERPELLAWLDERGIDSDGELLVLKREVALEGRNRAWINGSPTTATLLAELGSLLVSLHGQHEHQSLLRRDEQRAILDAYGGHDELLARVAAAHAAARALRQRIAELESRRREAVQRSDYLRFQAEEIEAAGLDPDEEARLEEEDRRLSHSEELLEISAALQQAIAADEDSLVTRFGALRKGLEQLARIDPSQEPMQELYDTAYYAMEELGVRLESYLGVVEHDPARLEQIRVRRDLLFRLRSKYGPSLQDVIAAGEAARRELNLIDDAGWELGSLQEEAKTAESELVQAATALTQHRSEALRRLDAEVNGVLPELGMPGGRFEGIALPLGQPGTAGAEEVEFRISLNQGFDPKPLAQVASGGELSRVMLALKTILARLDAVPTLVFDEVDSGVGGRIALQVGDKMREVASTHQVFAITHLPQIASRAHLHLLVRKVEGQAITATEVLPLGEEERVAEVARMLGGDADSRVSRDHARELLEKGAQVA